MIDESFFLTVAGIAMSFAGFAGLMNTLRRRGETWAPMVTGAGAPLERTVLFFAEWVARHERPHVKQVERTLSAIK